MDFFQSLFDSFSLTVLLPDFFHQAKNIRKSLRLKLSGLLGVESSQVGRQRIRFLGMRRTPLKIPKHTMYARRGHLRWVYKLLVVVMGDNVYYAVRGDYI